MKLTYTQIGDYLIPDLCPSERAHRPLGKYGMMRKGYLEEHRPILFNHLVLSERLYAHCAEVEAAACKRLEVMIPRLMDQLGITEQLKARDPLAWTGWMNQCKSQAEEVIQQELIFA